VQERAQRRHVDLREGRWLVVVVVVVVAGVE